MNQLKEITEIVTALVGNEYLYMDSPIQIKTTPHTPVLNIWAVCVSPHKDLYVMNEEEQWHQVDEKDSIIISSVYQRVKTLQSKFLKATA